MNTKKFYITLFTLIAVAMFAVACAGEPQQSVDDTDMPEEDGQIIDEGGLVYEEEQPGGEDESIEEEQPTDEGEMIIEEDQAGIIGTTWHWVRFDDMGEINNLDVEDPASYTLLLNEDGTYQLKADCNMASGGYTLDGSSLSFQSGPTTLAECGSDSHYDVYLRYISDVAAFVVEEDTLYLNLWADGGNMVFVPAE